jgi:hypothetical protein
MLNISVGTAVHQPTASGLGADSPRLGSASCRRGEYVSMCSLINRDWVWEPKNMVGSEDD